MLSNLQPFLTEVERQAFARVAAEGKAEGKAEDILKILTKRGVSITEAHRQRVSAAATSPCSIAGSTER
jgi:hypothetical protein